MPDRSGQPCYCECEELSALDLQKFGLLRNNRRLELAAKAQHHLDRIAPSPDVKDAFLFNVEAMGPVAARSVSIQDGQLIDLEDRTKVNTCSDLTLLASVLSAIGNTGLTSNFAVVVFNEDDQDWAVPHLIRLQSTERDTFFISIPDLMLTDQHVGFELLAFMILHELGHCYTDSGSECDADHWAADVGMRALYPGPGIINALSEAMEQFLRYQRSIRRSPSYIPGATGNTCEAEAQYPSYVCRSRAIRHILECMPVSAGNCSGYSSSCFENSTPKPPIVVDATLCGRSEVCGYALKEESRNVVELVLALAGARYYGTISELCTDLPTLCHQLPGVELNDLLNQKFNEAKIQRSMKKLTKRLKKRIRSSMERR